MDNSEIDPLDGSFDDVAGAMVAHEIKNDLLVATHTGDLELGDIAIPCHVLEDGSRVFSGREMQKTLGFSKGASGLALGNFIDTKLSGYLDEDTLQKFRSPLKFKRIGSGGSAPETFGFDAAMFIDICDAIIEAQREGKLTETQELYATSAQAIIRAVAKTGIIALVDEATGYQYDREKDALQKILDKFINDEKRKWAKTFPDEFWFKLVKIKGYDSYIAMNRPSYVGHWVNDIVYNRLAPGVSKKLKELNPRMAKGTRANKHHQFLSDDYGLPELKNHLEKVMVLMDASANKTEFEKLLNRSLPKYGDTIELPLDDPN